MLDTIKSHLKSHIYCYLIVMKLKSRDLQIYSLSPSLLLFLVVYLQLLGCLSNDDDDNMSNEKHNCSVAHAF